MVWPTLFENINHGQSLNFNFKVYLSPKRKLTWPISYLVIIFPFFSSQVSTLVKMDSHWSSKYNLKLFAAFSFLRIQENSRIHFWYINLQLSLWRMWRKQRKKERKKQRKKERGLASKEGILSMTPIFIEP